VSNKRTSTNARLRREVLKGQGLLVASGATLATYSVLIRALKAGGGPELPPAFLLAARYTFLFLFTAIQQWWWSLRAPGASSRAARLAAASQGVWPAAFELAAYTVGGTLLSIWGVSRIPSADAEVLFSTLHVFVPVLTLVECGLDPSRCGFGGRTWLSCAVSFVVALGSALYEPAGGAPRDTVAPRDARHAGQAAVLAASFVYAVARVRSSALVRVHAASALNTARMQAMPCLALGALAVDVARGGASRTALLAAREIPAVQWARMAASAFMTPFLASSLRFEASKVIPAASAQPFYALQPGFGALWGWLLLGEPVQASTMLTAAVMVGAAAVASTDLAENSGTTP
jgi:drug/metabolite transporter (DMT)-like permease